MHQRNATSGFERRVLREVFVEPDARASESGKLHTLVKATTAGVRLGRSLKSLPEEIVGDDALLLRRDQLLAGEKVPRRLGVRIGCVR